jgi:membrane-bound metal-dependent hydrolase YbcI (DUF457 family)
MAFVLTHTTAGYLAYEAARPAGRHRPGLLVASVALASAPDADFLPGIVIGQPGVFHRGVTHTIAAVAVVAMIGWIVGYRRAPLRWTGAGTALFAAVVYGSHLVLDFFTTNRRPPSGGRFLWPFSDAYYLAPVTPLREVVIDPSGRAAFFRSLVTPETASTWISEVSILLGGIALVQIVRAARAAWADSVAGADVAEGG